MVLDTRLTSAGHIILARGYDSDGNIIFNDPYGTPFPKAPFPRFLE